MSHGSFSAASKFLQDLNRPSRNIHVCLRPRHLPINNMGAGTETTPPVAAAQPPARTQAAAPPAGPEEVVLSLNEARLYAQAEHQAPALVAEGTLSIKLVDSPTPGQQQARGQVAGVFWSLGGNVACRQVNKHTFSFTVPESPGLLLTLLLPYATPDEDLATFVAVLASSTTFYEGEQQHPAQQQQPAGSAAPTAGNGYDHAASSVMSSAQWLSQNLRNAAATASTHISAAGVGLTQHLRPASEPVKVSPQTMKRLTAARDTAGKAVNVTGRVVQGVASAAMSVVDGVGWAFGANRGAQGAEQKQSGLRTVGKATLRGFAEVWDALEEAGSTVLRSVADSTTHVVHHKYGDEAAMATNIALGAATNVTEAYRNLNGLRPKALAMAAAKRAITKSNAQSGAKTTVTVEDVDADGKPIKATAHAEQGAATVHVHHEAPVASNLPSAQPQQTFYYPALPA